MQETTVARSYADALFDLAEAAGELQPYAGQLAQIAELVESERDFRLFLETPRIEPSVKKRTIRDVFEGHVADRLLRFLLVLIDNRRARVLPEIAREYTAMVDEHFGRLEVEITLAAEPDEALEQDLRQRLGRMLDREILPRYRINPRILGGVIVRVGDRIMDGSVRRRLQGLRRRMLKADIG
jgi:F-type H+-transporting ATPase subunit delta